MSLYEFAIGIIGATSVMYFDPGRMYPLTIVHYLPPPCRSTPFFRDLFKMRHIDQREKRRS
jgi:hypothetical protein